MKPVRKPDECGYDVYRGRIVFSDAMDKPFVLSAVTPTGRRTLSHFELDTPEGTVRYMPRPSRDWDDLDEEG